MQRSFVSVVLIFSLVLVHNTQATLVADCATEVDYPDATQFQMGECTDRPCLLKSKSMVNVRFRFTPAEDLAAVTTKVLGKLPNMPAPVPFPAVDGKDACKLITDKDGNGSQCPLKAGQDYYYDKTIKVESFYPKVPVTVTWGLVDGTQKSLICFLIEAKIVA